MFTSTVRQVVKALSLSFVFFAAAIMNDEGARAEETRGGSSSPVTLVDYICGDGMHFDYKQGCVIDKTKMKKEVGRLQDERRIGRSGDNSKARQASRTGV